MTDGEVVLGDQGERGCLEPSGGDLFYSRLYLQRLQVINPEK
jgi:hypothetical protein